MSAHDGHDDEPIRTSPKRMVQGIAIVAITLGVGAAILIPFFNEMNTNPPPVTQIRPPRPAEPEKPVAGTTTIAILSGAAAPGSPDFSPDEAKVPLGNKVVWDNQDTVPHTATSGTGPGEPDEGKAFDTGIVSDGEKSAEIEIAGAKEGDVFNYFCQLHPFMTSVLTIAAAGAGGEAAGEEGAATGVKLTIPNGAAVQGNPSYEPKELTVKKGDEISVVNEDPIPHTVTSGTGLSDPNSGKVFDTSIIDGDGGTAKIATAEIDPGSYDYFCQIHPFMVGKLTIN